jgi:hypothetical protein
MDLEGEKFNLGNEMRDKEFQVTSNAEVIRNDKEFINYI